MKIARTIGSVTLSRFHPSMAAASLRCVEVVDSIDRIDEQPLGGETVVAWDLCGTGIGNLVASKQARRRQIEQSAIVVEDQPALLLEHQVVVHARSRMAGGQLVLQDHESHSAIIAESTCWHTPAAAAGC